MSNWKLFFLVTALATCAMLVVLYIERPGSQPVPRLVSERGDVYVSPQISLRDVVYMSRSGTRTIVDMQPDDEAPAELNHLQFEETAKAQGLDFHYIPVPRERIPPATVNALRDVLASARKPVLLYCRTGRRAVRTFALTEASRPGGPDAEAIAEIVQFAGFSAEDLRPEIATRIAARTAAPETQP